VHPRLTSLRKEMTSKGIDSFLVTDMKNVRYVTGFTGSSGALMVDASAATLITDFRYAEQVEEETSGFDIRISKNPPFLEAAKIKDGARGRLGFEGKSMSCLDWRKLEEALPGVDLVPCEGLVESLRKVKDSYEIGKIRGAAEITDRVFQEILTEVKPGVSEAELAAEIDYRFRRRGASDSAFDTIVASGPRSSMPHARAGDRRLAKGDAITFDMGAVLGGYCSDMTRTVFLGRADDTQRLVYRLVLDAQEKAEKMVRPGVRSCDLDRAARSKIESDGYGENFGHRLGHGVGLEVHEEPVISAKVDAPVSEGMVFTIEPGVYLPRRYGVRIEDTVVVREDGYEILTKSSKELIEL
jgi:Xaa-Pro aminopeptidase